METGKQRTSLADRVRVELVIDPAPAALVDRVASVELAVRVVLVALVDPVALAGLAAQVALAGLENRVALAGLAAQVALAGLENRVALAELAGQVGLAELENQVGLAELAIELAELELVRVAVAQRTRLGTAAHLHDLVRHLAVEVDLVVVAAETTREPAVTEAATAWAAEE